MSTLAINSNWSNREYTDIILAYPMLSEQEEQQLSRAYKFKDCLKSAEKLVLAHLKLVYSVSKQYAGYNLSQDDLIQEGTIGLMKATKKFDPDAGVRLSTYAMYWIKAEIHEYIFKNFRMLKIVSNKVQRKIFFNLRSLHQKLIAGSAEPTNRMTMEQANSIANTLEVPVADVIDMRARIYNDDTCIDNYMDSDSGDYVQLPQFVDYSGDPVNQIEINKHHQLRDEIVHDAIESLNDRERKIIFSRYVNVSDTGVGLTLKDLSEEFGVSMERIRQIEVAAIKKMKKYLENCPETIV